MSGKGPYVLTPAWRRMAWRKLKEGERQAHGLPGGVELRRRMFFLGFHKTATTSLHHWLTDAGVRSVTRGGYRAVNNLAVRLFANHSAGRRLLDGIDGYEAYSDLNYNDGGVYLEGNALFRELHRENPDAFFLLNTRPTEEWLASRQAHARGTYVQRLMRVFGEDAELIRRSDASLHDARQKAIRGHFASANARFLEFGITREGIAELAAFLAPDYRLDPLRFPHVNAGRSGREAD